MVARWPPDCRDQRHGPRIFFYSPNDKQWSPGPSGTRVGYAYWSSRAEELFYQDLGEPDQSIYRFKPATGSKRLSFSFKEALRKDAVTCRLAGIGADDRLYAYVLEATSDLFAIDLDLPW